MLRSPNHSEYVSASLNDIAVPHVYGMNSFCHSTMEAGRDESSALSETGASCRRSGACTVTRASLLS